MNALLLFLGIGWIGLSLVFEAAQIWSIVQAANTVREGWTRVGDVVGPYNYPNMLFEPLIFMPGFVALAWRQNRIGKVASG